MVREKIIVKDFPCRVKGFRWVERGSPKDNSAPSAFVLAQIDSGGAVPIRLSKAARNATKRS